jgi:hypothetical protein
MSINFSGSIQMGYLNQFIKKFEWWRLYPAQDLLMEQPGDKAFNQFVSLVKYTDNKTILAYLPVKMTINIRKPINVSYKVKWFNPVKNVYSDGNSSDDGLVMSFTSPVESDMLLIIEAKQ